VGLVSLLNLEQKKDGWQSQSLLPSSVTYLRVAPGPAGQFRRNFAAIRAARLSRSARLPGPFA
jgi:hypothetical protein